MFTVANASTLQYTTSYIGVNYKIKFSNSNIRVVNKIWTVTLSEKI